MLSPHTTAGITCTTKLVHLQLLRDSIRTMSALRKIKRVGKKASKFQYTATYQSVVIECQRIETW